MTEDLWTKCEGVVYKYLNDCAALFVKCRKLSKFDVMPLNFEFIRWNFFLCAQPNQYHCNVSINVTLTGRFITVIKAFDLAVCYLLSAVMDIASHLEQRLRKDKTLNYPPM